MAHDSRVTAEHDAPPVTRILADFVATHPAQGWDEGVEREAHRTLLNWVGCAIGASRHATVEAALAAVRELAPSPQATILGRCERVDIASAAHAERHHFAHVRLTTTPTCARSSTRPAPSRPRRSRWPSTRAPADGSSSTPWCSASTSRAASATPSIPTTTTAAGTSPDRRACSAPPRPRARLLGLDAQRTAMALGIAASQPIGVREQFGSMTKPFHVGGAARAGLMSALMARHGFTASVRALEAPRGLDADLLDQVRLERDHGRARPALRDLVQHVQAVRLRDRDPSQHRWLRAARRRARARRRATSSASSSRCIRWCSN